MLRFSIHQNYSEYIWFHYWPHFLWDNFRNSFWGISRYFLWEYYRSFSKKSSRSSFIYFFKRSVWIASSSFLLVLPSFLTCYFWDFPAFSSGVPPVTSSRFFFHIPSKISQAVFFSGASLGVPADISPGFFFVNLSVVYSNISSIFLPGFFSETCSGIPPPPEIPSNISPGISLGISSGIFSPYHFLIPLGVRTGILWGISYEISPEIPLGVT